MARPTEEEMISWINKASYEQLLRKNRFSASGNLYFIGEVGIHYMKVMAEKKAALDPGEAAEISKKVGWSK
jgi:hypothetical protein